MAYAALEIIPKKAVLGDGIWQVGPGGVTQAASSMQHLVSIDQKHKQDTRSWGDKKHEHPKLSVQTGIHPINHNATPSSGLKCQDRQAVRQSLVQ